MLPPTPTLLADLVRLPSVNPMGRTDIPPDVLGEHRVTDYLEARLRAIGVVPRRVPASPGRDALVAEYVPPTPAPFSVMFECHQDTVPVDGMVIDPFGAAVENGRLYGRGACDVKAGAAAMLAAFARLVRERPAGSAAVTLAYSVDEEFGLTGVRALVAAGVRADFAVVAEPTRLGIVTAHKGVAGWRLETDGVACHSSRPDRGVNAVYRMAHLLAGTERYAAALASRPHDPTLGPPTLSAGVVRGGASPNAVPDFCGADLDRRLLPGEDPAAALADFVAFLKASPGVDFPFRATTSSRACPPLGRAGSGPLVERLGRAIDAVLGSHEIGAVPYGTDASTLAEAGVPAVVFGPGDIAQAHTKDEWVELAEVETAAEILFRLACGG